MIEVPFTIDKKQVFDNVSMLSSYIGVNTRTESGDAYEAIKIRPQDELLIKELLGIVMNNIYIYVREFLSFTEETDSAYVFRLQLPPDSIVEQCEAITTLISNFVARRVLREYFTISFPERAKEQHEMSMYILDEINLFLHTKNPPKQA